MNILTKALIHIAPLDASSALVRIFMVVSSMWLSKFEKLYNARAHALAQRQKSATASKPLLPG